MAANPHSALWAPLFDGLADPLVVARLAAEAEEVGWDGFFVWDRLTWPAPVERVADREQLAEMAETIHGLRPDPTAPFDIAMALPPGADPAPHVAAGATGCLTEFDPERLALDHVRGVLREGPATPAPAEVTS